MNDSDATSPLLFANSEIAGALRLANANAALWAIGNGLISTLLVIYLASDLGASGLSVSLILAAPRFAGLLRLGVPALMARLRARKTICITAYLLSSCRRLQRYRKTSTAKSLSRCLSPRGVCIT